MFEGFAHVWTPVELARRIGRKPVPLKLAGEAVVVFRDAQGQLAALLDQCPHRGVALSLGKVTKQGCLECPFHGWTFDKSGACTHVPLNGLAESKRARLSATALPVREAGGFVWLRTSLGAGSPDEPYVPEGFEGKGWHRWVALKTWRCHWTRAMENMLDSPHLPFVHRRSIGRDMRKQMKPDTVLDIQVEPTATGFRTDWQMDGTSSGASLEFSRPNKMTLLIPIPERKLRLHVWCVPMDAEHTRMIVASTRDFGLHNPLARLMDLTSHWIIYEDKAVVTSSMPLEVPKPSHEVSVATDRATLAFRSYYLAQLKPSSTHPSAVAPEPPGLSEGNARPAPAEGSTANILAPGVTGRA